jgi:enamine deaminase RidA (YjgF/YER057c/UK114 family)
MPAHVINGAKIASAALIMRWNFALLLCAAFLAAGIAAGQDASRRIKPPKKEKEPETQALPLPPEPPTAVIAETGKLAFHVSPLSGKGLLTQQVHDALKALDRANGGATFVKLRAFVAGTGDMRRVAAIVAEELSAKKMPLPAVTTVQVGALPLEGAQVVIESISQEKNDKKTLNPNGLAFLSAQRPAELAAAGKAQDAVMVQITCFLGDLAQVENARAEVAAAFPGASSNFVQPTRLAVEPGISCEGVGRLQRPGRSPARLVFTGAQMAFGDQEQALRLAYGRLGRALESMKASYAGALTMSVYSLSQPMADRAVTLSSQFLGPSARLAESTRIVEGLPSLDATVAIELVAAGP